MSYKHFTRDDRIKLSVLLKTGIKNKEIGRILNKDGVSIWREIKRNGVGGKYLPSVAKKLSKERKTHRKKKIENDQVLKKYLARTVLARYMKLRITIFSAIAEFKVFLIRQKENPLKFFSERVPVVPL